MRKKHGNKKLKIVERKLGRQNAWGLFYHKDNKIEIDPTQLSKMYLATLIHELLHMAQPELTEGGVRRVAHLLSKGVWQQGFRRIQK